MPLETATYLSDLVTSNPAHTDGLSQADSHMRLLKATIKATFPNFTTVALASTQAQLDAAATAAAGTTASRIPLGTAALPGLTPVGDTDTGIWSPAANQLAMSLAGVQVWAMGGTAIVTSLGFVTTLGIGAAAVASTGAYSGGTGQLVPIGAVLEWYDDVLPAEGGYAWANGQIIASANTVCPVLLARWGTRFGGNGTTTMGVPDRRDTVGVGKSTMGGVASRALQTLTNTVLGTLFGEANHQLAAANLPNHKHPVFLKDTGHVHSSAAFFTQSGPGVGGGGAFGTNLTTNTASALTGITIGSVNGTANDNQTADNAGGGGSHNNVQPSTTCNYILRLG